MDTLLQSGRNKLLDLRDPSASKQTKLLRTNTHSNNLPWGDDFLIKDSRVMRIACRNINSFPIHANDTRNLEFASNINQGSLDIYGLTETNVAWNRLDRSALTSERFGGKFEAAHWICSNDTQTADETKQIQQSGGTMLVCVNKLCHKILTSVTDKMERWTWLLLRGKSNLKLGVITI